MKIMATDLKDLGIIDEIVPEPDGGAHADHEGAAKLLAEVLERQLLVLSNQSPKQIVDGRYEKFRRMCQFFDLGA
jgi:acetyl-CoA carboxylase carboxyl transferase subunit alpha